MARRPIKKRKPRKTKFDKAVASALKSKPAPKNPKFKLEVGSEHDPFYVNPATIPTGVAIQWISLNVDDLERAQYVGWKPVEGQDGVKGNMLVWAPIEVAKAQTDANIKRAKEQMREMDELFGRGPRKENGYFPVVSQSFMVSSAYESVPSNAGPIEVDVIVKLRLSRSLQDAAAALKLSPQVYGQRRMDLYIRGDIGGLIIPIQDAVEITEYGNFQLTPRN